MKLPDLISESFAGALERPVQAMVTVLGTAIGIGTLVATIGIARTAGNQLVTEISNLAPTDIAVSVTQSSDPTIDVTLAWNDADAVQQIAGVIHSGAIAEVTTAPQVRTSPVSTNESLAGDVRIFAASPGLLPAIGARITSGRNFDAGHVMRNDPVALVGTAAAARLGLRPGSSPEAIFIGDQPFIVMGVFEPRIAPELVTSVVIPSGYAAAHLATAGPTDLHVSTDVGATEIVAQQVGLAIFPRDPSAISVTYGPQPTRTANRVADDVNALFLLLGALSLLVACFGIANTSLVTVMERTAEIGIRRALGITRRDIGAIFLIEAASLGGVGGLTGASAGLLTTVGVAAVRDWTPVLDFWLPLAAAVAGALTGVLAGAYPAVKAMTVEPVTALANA